MKFQEVDQPEDFGGQPTNWDDVFFPITVKKCVPTHKTLRDFLPEDDGRRFHDGSDWDERSGYESERNVDAVVGVGEAPSNED
jgi:hypothetical protein